MNKHKPMQLGKTTTKNCWKIPLWWWNQSRQLQLGKAILKPNRSSALKTVCSDRKQSQQNHG